MRSLLMVALLAFSSMTAAAQEAAPIGDPDKVPSALAPAIAQLHPQKGTVALGNELATLTLPEDMGYLTPEETALFLRQVVGYSAEVKTLGAVISLAHPIGSPASWYSLVVYDENGHVGDGDADTLDADAILKQITGDNDRHNTQLIQQGFRFLTVELNGWARTPSYDHGSHVLSWGFETKLASDDSQKILYNLRFLGRRGELNLMIRGSIEQLPMFESITPKLAAAIRFAPSNEYTDFVPGSDRPAPYSLAGLITGHTNGKKPVMPHQTMPLEAEHLQPWQWLGILALIAAIGIYLQRRQRTNR